MTDLLTLLFWLLFPALLARGVVWVMERGIATPLHRHCIDAMLWRRDRQ